MTANYVCLGVFQFLELGFVIVNEPVLGILEVLVLVVIELDFADPGGLDWFCCVPRENLGGFVVGFGETAEMEVVLTGIPWF